jgi:hypothetical protein
MSTVTPEEAREDLRTRARRLLGQRTTVGPGTAASAVAADLSELIRAEVALAQAELQAGIRPKAVGAGLFAVAGVAGWLGLQGLLITLGFVLAIWLPGWAAALIVTGVLLLVAAIAALAGAGAAVEAVRPRHHQVEHPGGRGVGETTPARPVTAADPSADGLADRLAAVETARAKLGRDLDLLNVEVRSQMSQTAQRALWTVVGTGAAALTGLAVRRVLLLLWRQITGHDAPLDPGARDTSWAEGIAWAVASGAAVGVGRMVAARGATAGWQKVMGDLPPGASKPTP